MCVYQQLIQANFYIYKMNLGISILDAQNKMEESKESQTRLKFYHFRPILSLKTSVEQWLPELLFWTPCLWGLENSLNPQFQRRKIELLRYHCPNYFLNLAPVYKEEKQNFFFSQLQVSTRSSGKALLNHAKCIYYNFINERGFRHFTF